MLWFIFQNRSPCNITNSINLFLKAMYWPSSEYGPASCPGSSGDVGDAGGSGVVFRAGSGAGHWNVGSDD